MMQVVLVDDEAPARRKLGYLLADFNDIAIIGEASSGGEAVGLLNRLKPDLVFLDIGLPDCTGLDVVEALEQREGMQFVFVTAYDDYALKAFDLHAIDYLLKPVQPSRFAEAVKRARKLIESGDATELAARLEKLLAGMSPPASYARRVLIQDGKRSFFLEVERIDFVESARNYVCLRAGSETHVHRSTLEAFATKLDPARFRRINRSQLVNLRRVAELRPWFHGDQKILLHDGTELSWSRRYMPASVAELERA